MVPRVVLASGSPQRREILERLGIGHEVRVPGTEEKSGGDPVDDVLANAARKAEAAVSPSDRAGVIVLACDTDVVLDGRILGKPESESEAAEFLERLSGRTHEVLSGLVVIEGESERAGVDRTEVAFRQLERSEIEWYLSTGEWRGRAGGYAIQGWGSALIDSVHGDISNVIGLPVRILTELAPGLGRSSR